MPYDNTITLKVDDEGKRKLREMEEYYEEYFKVLNPRASIIRRALDELYDKLLSQKQPA